MKLRIVFSFMPFRRISAICVDETSDSVCIDEKPSEVTVPRHEERPLETPTVVEEPKEIGYTSSTSVSNVLCSVSLSSYCRDMVSVSLSDECDLQVMLIHFVLWSV